ncbi:MAG TPA: hypothetical protein VGX95_16885 [Xanthobacteraceae bacterium]|jgi:hypothetical protein|nr:hypothetical protein [Xanthobacteraceae bacterium]
MRPRIVALYIRASSAWRVIAERLSGHRGNACGTGISSLQRKFATAARAGNRCARRARVDDRSGAPIVRRGAASAFAIRQADSLFFAWCCSNRSAVHVDSRLHCFDIAISSWLGGQYGEEGQEGEEGDEEAQGEEAVVLRR